MVREGDGGSPRQGDMVLRRWHILLRWSAACVACGSINIALRWSARTPSVIKSAIKYNLLKQWHPPMAARCFSLTQFAKARLRFQ
jgi:hypothetical protein